MGKECKFYDQGWNDYIDKKEWPGSINATYVLRHSSCSKQTKCVPQSHHFQATKHCA